jgi:hypothetical protein
MYNIYIYIIYIYELAPADQQGALEDIAEANKEENQPQVDSGMDMGLFFG